MKNAMQKDFWREIQHTRSRFFSIMILVALSVAFLSGLKATAPDMKRTGDDYLDSLHLADIQVLSTLGLTDDDITAIRAQDKVEDAEGEYVIDAFASSDSLDAVVKVLSLTGPRHQRGAAARRAHARARGRVRGGGKHALADEH